MKAYILLLLYIISSLLIRKEFHPFSLFPMYNSFINYGYVFFVKNEQGDILPFYKKFSAGKNAGYTAHAFGAFCHYHGYSFGFGKEDSVLLKQAGRELTDMLLRNEDFRNSSFDSLCLYKRYYYLKNGKLLYRDDLMYEKAIRP